MDPQKALDTWLAASLMGDRETAAMHAEALLGWLRKGGFEPKAEPIVWDLFRVWCEERGLES